MKILFSICFLFSCIQMSHAGWSQVWKVENLPNPESVVYDSNEDVVYVSNQNLQGEKGEASIGKISLNGDILDANWVKGLNEPKGMAIDSEGKKLYVSDVTELVVIDIARAKIVQRYQGEGAKFLNDVAIDSLGHVYVSDMFTSAIYKLSDGKFKLWMKDPDLQNPNGLLIEGDQILISAWGSFDNGNPLSADKGSVLQVSTSTGEIVVLSKNPVGNLDGLQKFGANSYLLSDWVEGDVFEYQDGVAKKVLDLDQSAGDIAYIKEKNLLLVPMAIQGEVIAFLR